VTFEEDTINAAEQKKLLQTQLWAVANELRGNMGADEFRDYILGFIFYKYLSERFVLEADELLEPDGIRFAELDGANPEHRPFIDAAKENASDQLGYSLDPNELFERVAAADPKATNIIQVLQTALADIERSTLGSESEDDFDSLFSELDLNSSRLGKTVEARGELVSRVLKRLAVIDFAFDDAHIDVLGDAYEYLIGQFASGAGKKAGEFYTPQEVSTLMARLVTAGKTRVLDVYDPTCGSGSLLLRIAREVEVAGGFYGQERNPTTYNLARMNMILHGIHFSKFDIKQEDTLEQPQHLGKQFEVVVANPPFSAQWAPDALLAQDPRFSAAGRLAPSSKADYAFILHMVHHLADNGRMVVVMPHGALFRGGAEGAIRKHLVADRNYLDAVIGLPPNVFFGTSIPACLMVFAKGRERGQDVLFVDASKDFIRGKNQNSLGSEHLDRIASTYEGRVELESFSHAATVEEIAANDFNLNIPRYVERSGSDDEVDLETVVAEMRTIGELRRDSENRVADYARQLGIDFPT
jgi:type I restriction enzyme M protein